jgi:glycerate-2-kinase
MSDELAAIVEHCYRIALEPVHAGNAVANELRYADGALEIDGKNYSVENGVYAIAIGKAAPEMLLAVEVVLGTAFSDGIAVTKTAPTDYTGRARILLGAHPTPDQRSLAAGRAVLDFARRVPDGALTLCLISGGGSALVEALREGVTLKELQRVTEQLLRAGASIQELNAVRSRLSAFKAGGLLAALSQTTVVNLIVSDVLGDDLSAIASGPTSVPNDAIDAGAVLQRYNLRCKLPAPEHQRKLTQPRTLIVANVSAAIDAAAGAAQAVGYQPVVLTRSLDGEAREVGRALASIVADTAAGRTSFEPPVAIIAGGETVVTVRGDGKGGRNSECALAAALRLERVERVAIGCLATDGDDASTGSAGAIVDGRTITSDNRSSARAALAINDSWTFLSATGATLDTGPTGTNVNDLVIALVGAP